MSYTKIVGIAFIIVVLFVGGVGWYSSSHHKTSTSADSNNSSTPQSYSFNATITQVSGQSFAANVGSIQNSGSGNQYVNTPKTITVTDKTVYYRHDFNTPAKFSDLAAGQQLIVYTASDPSNATAITAVQVLIQD